MTKISINSPGGGGSLPTGSLQLENGDAMDSTLRYVTDTANTQSKLLLSDTTTKIEGTLTVDGGAVIPRIIIDADTNVARILSFRTNDLPRWALRVDGTESGSNAGSDFAIRRYNDAGTFIDAPLSINRANGRVSIIERLLLEADSTATTQSTAVIQNPTANSGIAIVPNGTGAITTSIPDGTVTGGNARGQYAVDLQTQRNASNQVASNVQSIILGGRNNRNNGGVGVLVGGGGNAIIGGDFNFIGGGETNTINNGSVGFSVVSGGYLNTVTTSFGTISGGESNTASTGTHATVVGGLSNTSSGIGSISGGLSNNATNYGAMAIGGQGGNNASGYGSVAIGGGATASSTRGVAIGTYSVVNGGDGAIAFIGGQVSASGGVAFASSKTTSDGGFSFGIDSLSYLRNQFAQSPINIYGGNVVYYGFSQASQVVAIRQDTLSATGTTVLSLDGTGVTELIIPNGNNRSWNVNINWVAVVTAITGTATGVSVGDTFAQCLVLGFKKVGGISSIVGSSGALFTNSDASMLTSILTPTVGASQELALTFTAPSFSGGGSITCRIVAKVELVEVGYF